MCYAEQLKWCMASGNADWWVIYLHAHWGQSRAGWESVQAQSASQIRPGACVRLRGIITPFICSAQDNASWRVLAFCSLLCLQCQIKADAWPGSKPGMSRWQINHLSHLSRAAGHNGPVLTKEGKWECFTHSVPALCHAWRWRVR